MSDPSRGPDSVAIRLLAARLLEESGRELRLVRGASRRTQRKIARASATLLFATGILLGAPPLLQPARADSTPSFTATSTNPFDLDGDGDLDALIGESVGNTIFFRNTGMATAPAFAAPSTNPFGLAGVGLGAAPAFADLDGDLDALIVAGGTVCPSTAPVWVLRAA